MDELARLRLELETLWVTDAGGRLLHCRTDDAGRPPRLVVATCGTGICWATSAEVPTPAADRVAELLAGEPPSEAGVGWSPHRAAALVDALGSAGDLTSPHGGPAYLVRSGLPHEVGRAALLR